MNQNYSNDFKIRTITNTDLSTKQFENVDMNPLSNILYPISKNHQPLGKGELNHLILRTSFQKSNSSTKALILTLEKRSFDP